MSIIEPEREEPDYIKIAREIWPTMRQEQWCSLLSGFKDAAHRQAPVVIVVQMPQMTRLLEDLRRQGIELNLRRFKRALAATILADPILRENMLGEIKVKFSGVGSA
jgi:hypothetical protein